MANQVEDLENQDHKCVNPYQLKLVACFSLILIIPIAAFLILDLTILRVTAPEYSLSSAAIVNQLNSTDPSSPDRLSVELSLKNRNNGPFTFPESIMSFEYEDESVVEAVVPAGRVRAKSTKNIHVNIDINSTSIFENRDEDDVELDKLTLHGTSELNGQVQMMNVFTTDKSIRLSCHMIVDLVNKLVREIKCD